MTVSSTTAKNSYAGTGAQDTFAYSFPILDETHLLVQIKDTNGDFTTKVLTTDYTVTGTGNDSGSTNYTSGNVVFGAGDIPLSTDTVVISRSVPLLQGTDYTENDTFPAESHEEALDELTMIAQQLDEEIDRSVKVDIAVAGEWTLPTPVSDLYIKYNSSADGLEAIALTAGGGIASVLDDPSPQLGGNLDTNGRYVAFDDAFGIIDSAANEQLIFQETASAINHVEITNAATGNDPIIGTAGDNTNIGLTITPKGTGEVTINTELNIEGNIIQASDATNYFAFLTNSQKWYTGGAVRMSISNSGFRVGTTGAIVTTIADDDALSGDSATSLVTEQAIKAYADTLDAHIVQTANLVSGGVSTGTTAIPIDNTIPQISEGTAFLTRTFTPTSTTNLLRIDVTLNFNHSVANEVTVALFDGSTDAIAANFGNIGDTSTGGLNCSVSFTHWMTAGTVSEITFTVRAGPGASGTLTVNGSGGVRSFGGVSASSITVAEYNA